jgi:hypothetical protein
MLKAQLMSSSSMPLLLPSRLNKSPSSLLQSGATSSLREALAIGGGEGGGEERGDEGPKEATGFLAVNALRVE